MASQGPEAMSAGFPCRRVAGPGAPAAAQAPALTESILVQVAGTSSGTMFTSRQIGMIPKQKNPPPI